MKKDHLGDNFSVLYTLGNVESINVKLSSAYS